MRVEYWKSFYVVIVPPADRAYIATANHDPGRLRAMRSEEVHTEGRAHIATPEEDHAVRRTWDSDYRHRDSTPT